ncbi:RNA-binding protein [archaeon]|nr:MAG: RNA-binding protein [archaeon]
MDTKLVLPGDLIGERKGRRFGRGTFVEGENVYSAVLGIPRASEVEISVIPMSGVYLPVMGDRVIGTIKSVEVSGWTVDINSPYTAFLPLAEAVDEYVDTSREDISRFFDVGDVIFCRISKVTKGMNVQASMRDMMSRKLFSGAILNVTPSKIPRIIGKAGSMVQLIKQKTKCDIYTGQNGLVWIRGDDKAKAIETILMIERESHLKGLTEKVEKMLG